MRHAIGRPRYATVASWLVVTALGLGVGAIGVGGLVDLFSGPDDTDTLALDATPVVGVPGAGAGAPGTRAPSAADGPSLSEQRVVSPSQIPEGSALAGRAPDPRTATDGRYVAFRPTSLRMPSGRLAPVERAGVHPDGALEIPRDPDRVGWWTGGAQADEPYGGIVLAGHVDSRTLGVGALAELLEARPGQTVRLGDGRHSQLYRVKTVRKVLKAKLTAATDLFAQDVRHRLVMITCGGPFDERTHRYRDNVVVVADPVG